MIIIDVLSGPPPWLLAAVLSGFLMSPALVGLWGARRWLLPRLRLGYDDAYYAAALVQSCSRRRSSTA